MTGQSTFLVAGTTAEDFFMYSYLIKVSWRDRFQHILSPIVFNQLHFSPPSTLIEAVWTSVSSSTRNATIKLDHVLIKMMQLNESLSVLSARLNEPKWNIYHSNWLHLYCFRWMKGLFPIRRGKQHTQAVHPLSFGDIDQDKINGTVCAAADVLSQSVRFNLIAASESFVSGWKLFITASSL